MRCARHGGKNRFGPRRAGKPFGKKHCAQFPQNGTDPPGPENDFGGSGFVPVPSLAKATRGLGDIAVVRGVGEHAVQP